MKLKEMMNVEALDEETAIMNEGMVVLRLTTTKHINFWLPQLEMKRREICELACLMMKDEVKHGVQNIKKVTFLTRQAFRPMKGVTRQK